jgi:hypothetical protein
MKQMLKKYFQFKTNIKHAFNNDEERVIYYIQISTSLFSDLDKKFKDKEPIKVEVLAKDETFDFVGKITKTNTTRDGPRQKIRIPIMMSSFVKDWMFKVQSIEVYLTPLIKS